MVIENSQYRPIKALFKTMLRLGVVTVSSHVASILKIAVSEDGEHCVIRLNI